MSFFSRFSRPSALVITFLSLQVLIAVRNWVTDYWLFYWYCDFAPLGFAVLFYWRNVQAVKGLMYIGLIGQTLYLISFVSILIFGVPFAGFDLPVMTQPIDTTISFIMHLSTAIAFVATWHEKPEPRSLAYAMAILIVMYGSVLLFTTPNADVSYNYNYIYSGALQFMPFYTTLWVPFAFLLVVLPTYGLDKLLFAARTYHQPKIRFTHLHAH